MKTIENIVAGSVFCYITRNNGTLEWVRVELSDDAGATDVISIIKAIRNGHDTIVWHIDGTNERKPAKWVLTHATPLYYQDWQKWYRACAKAKCTDPIAVSCEYRREASENLLIVVTFSDGTVEEYSKSVWDFDKGLIIGKSDLEIMESLNKSNIGECYYCESNLPLKKRVPDNNNIIDWINF